MDEKDLLIQRLKQEIDELKKEINKLKMQSFIVKASDTYSTGHNSHETEVICDEQTGEQRN